MKRFLALLFSLVASAALAQNVQCPTRPAGDNTNACASTAFVLNQIASGSGLVNSITNADGTLTIAPTTGAAIASLNLTHANTWTALQTFNGGIAGTSATTASLNLVGTQALSGNGPFISGVYGPVQVPASTSSAMALSSFFTTSGDRGQTAYTGLFNQTTTSAGQGGNWYGFTSLSTMSGTWTPAASGISGAIGIQGGAVSSRGGFTFGGNTYCTTQTVAATECIGFEIDTNNTVNGTTDKIGMQVVDISTSTGTTTGISTAFLAGAQSGANLFNNGLNISAGNGVFPIKTTGTAILVTGGTVTHGLDMTGLTCSTDCIKVPANVFIGGQIGTFQLAVSRADSTLAVFAGTTKAVRIVNTATLTTLDGVDNTGTGSFQPLGINGSTVEVQVSGTRIALFNAAAHLSYVGGVAPTLTAGCNGAGSVVSGNDVSGTITGQTAAATTCTLTFGTAYGAAPNCVAMGQSSPLTGAATPATGTLVVSFASTANYKFSYYCPGA